MSGTQHSAANGGGTLSRLRAHYAAAIHRAMHIMDRHHREPLGAPGTRSSYTLANPHAPGVLEDTEAVILISQREMREELPQLAGARAAPGAELLKGVELAVLRGISLYVDGYVDAVDAEQSVTHALPVDPVAVLDASEGVLGDVLQNLRESGLVLGGTEEFLQRRREETAAQDEERGRPRPKTGSLRAISAMRQRGWRVRKDGDTIWVSRSAGGYQRWSPAYRLTRAQARLLAGMLYSASEQA